MKRGDLFGLRLGEPSKHACINYCKVLRVKPDGILGWVINGEYQLKVTVDGGVTVYTPFGRDEHRGRIVYAGAFPDSAKRDYNLAIQFINLRMVSRSLLGRGDVDGEEYAALFLDSSNGQDERDERERMDSFGSDVAF